MQLNLRAKGVCVCVCVGGGGEDGLLSRFKVCGHLLECLVGRRKW